MRKLARNWLSRLQPNGGNARMQRPADNLLERLQRLESDLQKETLIDEALRSALLHQVGVYRAFLARVKLLEVDLFSEGGRSQMGNISEFCRLVQDDLPSAN
jgi:hypothetical protein